MIKASLDLGYGISRTVGKEYQISSRIEARIPRDAKTGYYKMQVCYNFYKMKILQKRASDNVLIDVQYVAMPYGTSYAAVLYSKDMNSWKLW